MYLQRKPQRAGAFLHESGQEDAKKVMLKWVGFAQVKGFPTEIRGFRVFFASEREGIRTQAPRMKSPWRFKNGLLNFLMQQSKPS